MGFIEFKEKGDQKYKYILLFHPHDVVQQRWRAVPRGRGKEGE